MYDGEQVHRTFHLTFFQDWDAVKLSDKDTIVMICLLKQITEHCLSAVEIDIEVVDETA